ncbi:MAG: hypothetical protein ACI9CD_000360 [Candidatus Deianiraeaceae bacterium]|jgi:hypothetical protein
MAILTYETVAQCCKTLGMSNSGRNETLKEFKGRAEKFHNMRVQEAWKRTNKLAFSSSLKIQIRLALQPIATSQGT